MEKLDICFKACENGDSKMRGRLTGAMRGRRKWAWGLNLADVWQISYFWVMKSMVMIAGVRYALEYARKQEELRQQKPLNRADQGGIRHPATDIINSLNPITWWVREGFIWFASAKVWLLDFSLRLPPFLDSSEFKGCQVWGNPLLWTFDEAN